VIFGKCKIAALLVPCEWHVKILKSKILIVYELHKQTASCYKEIRVSFRLKRLIHFQSFRKDREEVLQRCDKVQIPRKSLTDQDCMHEQIKSRLNSGNVCYLSVQSLPSSRLLSRNITVKIYKTIILPVVLFGCESWSLTLRKEHRLRVFKNRVLRRISGPKSDELTGEWRKLNNGELPNLYLSPDIISRSN
jgi:hypothetical protein